MDAVICGIDPGLGTTGYAVVLAANGKTSVMDAGVCR
ncbi:MAG: crossover junction endodeoxyribonuclease RuvC, partial [Phycisphaerales bacterium]